ncbi:toprim domain-containing protein [Asticcacaulis sp. W401b]|uniref:toprim domain-containing protein n=1 Tax=Asticcacaulis sp. W401b TaxID=3388666 RepID=UPI003970EEC8
MVVAEGIPSALSASQFFSLPCHALLGVKSFPYWRPPQGVRHIVIAAEPGKAGELCSGRLHQALIDEGYACRREFPPKGFSDFNAFYGGYG